VALEKCKQALRQHRDKSGSSDGSYAGSIKGKEERRLSDESTASETSNATSGFHLAAIIAAQSLEGANPGVSLDLTTLFPTRVAGTGPTFIAPVDPRLVLFQQSPLAFQHLMMSQQMAAMNCMNFTQFDHMNLLNVQLGVTWPQQTNSALFEYVQAAAANCAVANRNGEAAIATARAHFLSRELASLHVPIDKDDAAHVLSALAIADRPKITQEQEEAERASMTDEERAAVLADMFGKMCAVTPRQRKRARRDLDRKSIDFLVQHMKLELEKIPANRKQPLMEAKAKCRPEDFSDARLEKFLRCEGMNAEVCTLSVLCFYACENQCSLLLSSFTTRSWRHGDLSTIGRAVAKCSDQISLRCQ